MAWMKVCPSPAPSAVEVSPVVIVDATETAGSLPRTLYGLALSHLPDVSELQILSAQGVAVVTVPAPDDEKAWSALQKVADEWGLKIIRRTPNGEPLSLRTYPMPSQEVSVPVGLAQALQGFADKGVPMSACAMPDGANAMALRTFRLLENWAQLYGSRARVTASPPLVAIATRREDSVSVCVANSSSKTVPAQLNLRLPPGAYRVEVRRTDSSGFPSATVEKPPLWVTSSARLMPLTVDLPPQSLAALRLTNLPLSAYNDSGDLMRQIASAGTFNAREKVRALNCLRSARKPLGEVLDARKLTPEAVSRAAHRSLLQIGQAEAVFRNEVEKGRVGEDMASAVSGQFEEVTHLLSAASAAGLGLRLSADSQSQPGKTSCILQGQETIPLSVWLAHQGSLPIAHVAISVQTDDALSAEPLSPTSFARLSPRGEVGCRFHLRAASSAPMVPQRLRAAVPILAQVTVSYYAQRSNARLTRTVEFYQE
jgi:hypothetical protein